MSTTDTHHRHQEHWLVAAAHRDLTSHELHLLADHLSTCPECLERAEDVEVIAHVEDVLAARRVVAPGLEDRLVRAFREQTREPEEQPTRAAVAAAGLRAARLAVACLAAAVLVVRGLNIRFYSENFPGATVLSALWNGLLRVPEYAPFVGHGNILKDHDVLLATVHKLATLYVGILLWTLLVAAIGLLAVDVCRRRCRLMMAG